MRYSTGGCPKWTNDSISVTAFAVRHELSNGFPLLLSRHIIASQQAPVNNNSIWKLWNESPSSFTFAPSLLDHLLLNEDENKGLEDVKSICLGPICMKRG